MHRLLALGCVLTLGCASQPIAQAPGRIASPAAITASVDAGPPACEALRARISGSGSQLSEVPTWLAAPVRMVEDRRLRALRARADELGCPLPRS